MSVVNLPVNTTIFATLAAAGKAIWRRALRGSSGLLIVSAIMVSTPWPTPEQPPDVFMPPNTFIHPFPGAVTVMSLPHRSGAPLLSLSHHDAGRCAIWLPKVGDPGVTEGLYKCLVVIEVANCNGAVDINTPAVRARTSSPETMSYNRACSQSRWDWAYDAVRGPALFPISASIGPAEDVLRFFW